MVFAETSTCQALLDFIEHTVDDGACACVQGLLQRFSQHRAVWGGVVEAMAQVDALASLAAAAVDASAQGPVCRPEFVSADANDGGTPAVSLSIVSRFVQLGCCLQPRSRACTRS